MQKMWARTLGNRGLNGRGHRRVWHRHSGRVGVKLDGEKPTTRKKGWSMVLQQDRLRHGCDFASGARPESSNGGRVGVGLNRWRSDYCACKPFSLGAHALI
jgi:hypothetical protein